MNGELIHILDILHALCGYCSEGNIGLGHYAPYSKKTKQSFFFLFSICN